MKNDISIAEIHALYVEKALMGTPDHLRDKCAAALGVEANRQAKAMGLYGEDLTPAVFGLLEVIRYQERVAMMRADLDAAIAVLSDMPDCVAPPVRYAVKYVLKAVDACTAAVQAASNHAANQCRACGHCKAPRPCETDC